MKVWFDDLIYVYKDKRIPKINFSDYDDEFDFLIR